MAARAVRGALESVLHLKNPAKAGFFFGPT